MQRPLPLSGYRLKLIRASSDQDGAGRETNSCISVCSNHERRKTGKRLVDISRFPTQRDN